MSRHDPSLPRYRFDSGQRKKPLDHWPDNKHYFFRMSHEQKTAPGPLGIVASRYRSAANKEVLKSMIKADRKKVLRDIPDTAYCHGGSSSSKRSTTNVLIRNHIDRTIIEDGTPFI
jgi:hypothetical protein